MKIVTCRRRFLVYPSKDPLLLVGMLGTSHCDGKARLRNVVLERTRAYSSVLVHTRAYSSVLERTRAYSSVLVRTRAYSCVLERTRAYSSVLVRTRAYARVLACSRPSRPQWHFTPPLLCFSWPILVARPQKSTLAVPSGSKPRHKGHNSFPVACSINCTGPVPRGRQGLDHS